MSIETMECTAPSAWASYLVNGDASGLEDTDIEQCDAWLAAMPDWFVVSCEDAGFMRVHDAYPHCPYAADCQTYTFHKVQS